ncbi:AAA family ATPase [Croceibacterium salegens]|nr:AAA family ATPase [Croceibacterium salegens]
MAMFTEVILRDWRQFSHVQVPLESPCTIITGVNGSGKTTLLTILSKHFGWNLHFVSTPLLGKKRAQRYYSDIYDPQSFSETEELPEGSFEVGSIAYGDGAKCTLSTKARTGANYHLDYNGIQQVAGLYIPSHRPVSVFAPVNDIPTNPIALSQLYQSYFSVLSQSMMSAGNLRNPALTQKQNIIALAVFGESSEHVEANPEYVGRIKEFEAALKQALPQDLGFERLIIRSPDIVLRTKTGDFSIDSMSGGINAIFSIVWQIYCFGIGKTEFVVAIDEPENHLHPSMQKTFLPNLLTAFPHVKFIVATHSPFIVSSFAEATVVSLQRTSEDGPRSRIHSEILEAADLSATPNSILRDVLKVDSVLPIWVDAKIRELLKMADGMPDEQRGSFLMNQLEELGIGDSIAEYGASQ